MLLISGTFADHKFSILINTERKWYACPHAGGRLGLPLRLATRIKLANRWKETHKNMRPIEPDPALATPKWNLSVLSSSASLNCPI